MTPKLETVKKSLGNLVFVSDLIKEWDPMAVRMAIVTQHYRSSWDWQDELLSRAAGRFVPVPALSTL